MSWRSQNSCPVHLRPKSVLLVLLGYEESPHAVALLLPHWCWHQAAQEGSFLANAVLIPHHGAWPRTSEFQVPTKQPAARLLGHRSPLRQDPWNLRVLRKRRRTRLRPGRGLDYFCPNSLSGSATQLLSSSSLLGSTFHFRIYPCQDLGILFTFSEHL